MEGTTKYAKGAKMLMRIVFKAESYKIIDASFDEVVTPVKTGVQTSGNYLT